MTVLRDHYFRLASEVPSERIGAATDLLSELISENNPEDWDYAVERLIKGLTSTRQCARLGFSMALTEIVRELVPRDDHALSVSLYMDKLFQMTEIKSSMKGKEERAVLFGKLFGLQVILNSNLIKDPSYSSLESMKVFVSTLISLSCQKVWMRETAIYSLCTFLQSIKKLEDRNKIILFALQEINDKGLNLTTEGIAVYLSISEDERKLCSSSLSSPKQNWKNGDPMTKGNLPLLARALKESEATDTGQFDDSSASVKQKANWNPKLHFVWAIIAKHFLDVEIKDDEYHEEQVKSSKKRKKISVNKKSKSKKGMDNEQKISIGEFWKVAVDEVFFAEKSSHERKYWGFEIEIIFLNALNEEEISLLFTPNFLRCLINQSSNNNRMLHKMSLKVLESFISCSKEDIAKAPVILSRIIRKENGGCWNFDLVTKSKTTDNLLNVLVDAKVAEEDADTILGRMIETIIVVFRHAVDTQEEIGSIAGDKKSNDSILKWCLDKVLYLCKVNKRFIGEYAVEGSWLGIALSFLIRKAFFKSNKKNDISNAVREQAQQRLESIVSQILTLDKNNPLKCLQFIVKCIKELALKRESVVVFDDTLEDVKSQTSSFISIIQEERNISKPRNAGSLEQAACFEILFSMLFIQYYMGDEEAFGVFEDVKLCYDSTFAQTDEYIDVSLIFTEIVLSFVSQKSGLLKRMAHITWASFLCSREVTGKLKIDENCLKLLFDVLVTRENKEGQKTLFDDNSIEAGDDSSATEDDESESEADESESTKREQEEKTEASDTGSVDEDSDLSDGEDGNSKSKLLDEVDQRATKKLAEALGIPRGEDGEVKFGELDDESQDDSYESEELDDDAMIDMDEQLSKIFKERHEALSSITTGNKRKLEVAEAKERIIFFKSRVLDLLEILNRHAPNLYYNLSMIEPLLSCINLTLDKNLYAKAHKFLKSKVCRARLSLEEYSTYFATPDEQDAYKKYLFHMLESVHKKALSAKSNAAHSAACSQSSMALIKNLISIDDSYIDTIIDLYTATMKSWVKDKKSKLPPSIFFDLINWLVSRRS